MKRRLAIAALLLGACTPTREDAIRENAPAAQTFRIKLDEVDISSMFGATKK